MWKQITNFLNFPFISYIAGVITTCLGIFFTEIIKDKIVLKKEKRETAKEVLTQIYKIKEDAGNLLDIINPLMEDPSKYLEYFQKIKTNTINDLKKLQEIKLISQLYIKNIDRHIYDLNHYAGAIIGFIEESTTIKDTEDFKETINKNINSIIKNIEDELEPILKELRDC